MAGYSGKPLAQKMGIKPGFRVHFRNVPESVVSELTFANEVEFTEPNTPDLDFIHACVTKLDELDPIYETALKSLKPNGMLWMSWPKKSSKVPTEVDENIIRDIGLAAGLVDVKICAVDEIWSGLKFVRRLRDR